MPKPFDDVLAPNAFDDQQCVTTKMRWRVRKVARTVSVVRNLTTKGPGTMIGVYLQLGTMSESTYRDIDAKVQAAGVSEEGCLLHTCFKEGENLAVFDVWNSKEAFEAFAAQLGPIAMAAGATSMPTTQFVEMVTFEPR